MATSLLDSTLTEHSCSELLGRVLLYDGRLSPRASGL
jgi:hypothetical protein